MTRQATLPADPKSVAEMIPVRQAEIAARKAPLCSQQKNHGRMRPVTLESQSYERMYCGVWYECAQPGCQGNAHWLSRELAAYHGEPYVVDETHWETWDGQAWQPVSKAEFDAFHAEGEAERQRIETARRATARRQRSASHRHARGAAI